VKGAEADEAPYGQWRGDVAVTGENLGRHASGRRATVRENTGASRLGLRQIGSNAAIAASVPPPWHRNGEQRCQS
jgi:hypothetical protein